jgi:selenocysteine-specific elongation factor
MMIGCSSMLSSRLAVDVAVIATAGHVDHGKSALVRAMTGIEPDRFEEERRRGLTLDLGFAHTVAPDGTLLDIVDVPGHEDLVRTMIAGANHASVALLVIDAVEGPRAQTYEHMKVLEGVGINVGVVAISRCDLVDGDHLDLVDLEVRDLLAVSRVDWASIVHTSAVTGAGIELLVEALAEAVRAGGVHDRYRAARPARLVVDRSFHIAGSGTVVTGTLDSGNLARGMVLDVNGRSTTVRALQRHGNDVDSVAADARCAVNLSGIEVAEVVRGDVLCEPGRWAMTEVFDARVDRDTVDSLPRRVEIHLAGARRHASVRLLPTTPNLVRIRFSGALPLRPRDRLVMRSIGSGRVLAGIEVLDVSPVLRPSRAKPDGSVESIIAPHGWLRTDEAARLVGDNVPETIPGWVAATGVVGVTLEQLRKRLESGPVPTTVLSEPERLLIERIPGVVVERGEARLGDRDPVLDHEVVGRVRDGGVTPPSVDDVDRAVLGRLVRLGIFMTHDGVYFHVDAVGEVNPVLEQLWEANPDGFTVSMLRETLGITRKHAVPLAECLDDRGATRRVGDRRVRGSAG